MILTAATVHAGCGDSQRALIDGAPLVVVAEGATARVALADDVRVLGAPAWITRDGPALMIAPPCDAVPGAIGARAFEIAIVGADHREALEIMVAASRTAGCAPRVVAWEVGAAASCDPIATTTLARVCVRASSLACIDAPPVSAPGRLCVGVDTQDPDVRAYVAATSTVPTTLAAPAQIPSFALVASSWGHALADAPAVAGLFEVAVGFYDAPPAAGGSPFAVGRIPVQVGDPGDAFVDVRDGAAVAEPAFDVRELNAVTRTLTPYVFGATGPLTLRITRLSLPGAPRDKQMIRLRDPASATTVTCDGADPCVLTATSFELGVSPPFDSAAIEGVRIEAVIGANAIALDATPADPTTTDLPVVVHNAGDDVVGTSGYPAQIACTSLGAAAGDLLILTGPTTALWLGGWPLAAPVALTEVPRRALGVVRADGVGASKAVLVGVFDAAPHVRELVSGAWVAIAPGAGAPWPTGPLALGALRAPAAAGDTAFATHLVYVGASGALEVACVSPGVCDPTTPAQLPLDPVAPAAVRAIVGADLTAGERDKLVLGVDGATGPQICELRPRVGATLACTSLTSGAGPIVGSVQELVVRQHSPRDSVFARVADADASAVYHVCGFPGELCRATPVEIVALGKPTGLAAGVLSDSVYVATRFGISERVADDADDVIALYERDPIRLERGAAGAVVMEPSDVYGTALTLCAPQPGATPFPRAAWVVAGATGGWTVRLASVDIHVAGPWPVETP